MPYLIKIKVLFYSVQNEFANGSAWFVVTPTFCIDKKLRVTLQFCFVELFRN